jgi:hypothetical protein
MNNEAVVKMAQAGLGNFKSGGVLEQVGTAGIAKGDKNGHLNGEHSHTQVEDVG